MDLTDSIAVYFQTFYKYNALAVDYLLCIYLLLLFRFTMCYEHDELRLKYILKAVSGLLAEQFMPEGRM